jgi:2-polyprenyl-3-methyl-5-hydroxy-6-metoxy-1,4-benzoquinol methylase
LKKKEYLTVDTYNEKVVDYWSRVNCSTSDKNFYLFPPLRTRSCRLLFGEDDAGRRDWCEYWTVKKYLKDQIPVEKCLSICCGFGEIERILSRLNVANKITGTDIAPEAIRQAKEQATTEGISNIEYYVSDLNKETLPANAYDIIWANGALHHIEDLDRVIPMLKQSLKPGGYLFSNEYVGPNYQQLGWRQQEIINAVKHLLPTELCEKKVIPPKNPLGNSILSKGVLYWLRKFNKYPDTDNSVYGKIFQVKPIEELIKTDPSECVNSSSVIPTLQKHFKNVEVKYYDGSLLKYTLANRFYENYDLNNSKHKKLLELLFHIEDTLISTGELPRDHALIICKNERNEI